MLVDILGPSCCFIVCKCIIIVRKSHIIMTSNLKKKKNQYQKYTDLKIILPLLSNIMNKSIMIKCLFLKFYKCDTKILITS